MDGFSRRGGGGAINLINFEIKLKLVQWNSSYTLNLMQDIIICVL